MSNHHLLGLLQLSDPALPIGGFAHSSGLETYVQHGVVHDKTSATAFITNMLTYNLQYNDAAFMSLAFDAATKASLAQLLELDELCTAVKLPREMRQASQKLGMRLMKLFTPLARHSLAAPYLQCISGKSAAGHYCLAFGLFAHALGIPKKDALMGYFYNAAAGMVTNSVKLVPLGQQDGQEMLFSLQPLLASLADNTMQPAPELLGLCCPGFDTRCMQHEHLYSRLYMS